ncbi:hypothetical protein [Streptomyces sp. NPDC059575]|uniref:hypothetical protein n=1 Tax=Streptomyces sp. NPDC059575 TaxID=3346872 RepID=UPI0036BCA54E
MTVRTNYQPPQGTEAQTSAATGGHPHTAAPACAECVRLENEQYAAEREGDLSRAVDCRVLLRRHRADDHKAEQ